jgi:hypothetical protein
MAILIDEMHPNYIVFMPLFDAPAEARAMAPDSCKESARCATGATAVSRSMHRS